MLQIKFLYLSYSKDSLLVLLQRFSTCLTLKIRVVRRVEDTGIIFGVPGTILFDAPRGHFPGQEICPVPFPIGKLLKPYESCVPRTCNRDRIYELISQRE